MDVYCLKAGDSIECGCGLVSIHVSYEGARIAAIARVKEENEFRSAWDDQGDFEYVEDESECKGDIVSYWKQRAGYDIIMITKDLVLEIV